MSAKDELEKKRQKLAELRKSREERKTTFLKSVESTTGDDGSPSAAAPAGERENVDDLVASLVGTAKPADTAAKAAAAAVPVATTAAVDAASAAAPAAAPAASEPSPAKRQLKLGGTERVLVDIPPKETVLYSKEVQTDEIQLAEPASEDVLSPAQAAAPVETQTLQQTVDDDDDDDDKPKKPSAVDLSDDEKKRILNSEDFLEFFDRSTKLVERALHEPFDVLIDYASLGNDNETDKKAVKLLVKFSDDRLTANRVVTDLQWSPKHPELLLAAYNSSKSASVESNGIALVWSLHLPERPEYVFQAQNSVLSARFSPYNPNLIVGGTYSGQLLVWDIRAKSLPIDKTSLVSQGHTHPVYQLEIIGTQNAHNIISASTDGLVCSWAMDLLSKPQESLQLTGGSHQKSVEVAVTTFGFPDNETTSFLIGTEEGTVYQASRMERAGTKAGLNSQDVYKGHFGPITSLHFHSATGVVDFSDLVLTTSTDWTTKLWRLKSSSSKVTGQIPPLHSFDFFTDYVFDARWSPVHPAMFAAVDGDGRLTIWNLNVDTEAPVTTIQVTSDGAALNKVRWDNEGKKLAVGTSTGAVFVYDVGELGTPRLDEWSLLQRTLADLESARRWNVGH